MTEPDLDDDDDDQSDDDGSNDIAKPSWLKLHVGFPLAWWFCVRWWRLRRFLRSVGRWWHCFRFGMLPLGEWIHVESIKVCGVEQLGGTGGFPGSVFAPGAVTGSLGTMVQVGQLISIHVRNVGHKPVRFRAVARLTARHGLMIYPLPDPLINVGEVRQIGTYLDQSARLEGIIIAEYVPKERGAAPN